MKKNNSRFPFYILWMIPVYILNVLILIGLQCAFVHTNEGPLELEQIKKIEYFKEKEIVDIYNTVESPEYISMNATPSFVLFQAEDSTNYIVRLEWNPLLFRFAIEDKTAQSVAQEAGEIEIEMGNFLGKDAISIENGTKILSVEQTGVVKNQNYYDLLYWVVPFIMVLPEYFFYRIIKKKVVR